MNSLVLSNGKKGIALKQSHVRKIVKNEVLVRIRAAGICATDVKITQGLYYNTNLIKDKVILGHEGVGDIIQIGCDVRNFKVGERVAFEAINPCGQCYNCRKGLTNICSNWKHLGINMDGVFAEYAVIPEAMLHKLPEGISYDNAALLEPLAIAVYTVERLNVNASETCAIIGPGPLGLVHIPVLLSKGIKKVTVFGLAEDEIRLSVAKRVGAHDTVKLSKNSSEFVTERFDLVIDTSGSGSAVDLTYKIIENGGRIALLGIDNTGQYRTNDIIKKNLTITAGKGMAKRHMDRAIQLLEKSTTNISNLITHRYSLEEYEEAFKVCQDKAGIKILFVNEGDFNE